VYAQPIRRAQALLARDDVHERVPLRLLRRSRTPQAPQDGAEQAGAGGRSWFSRGSNHTHGGAAASSSSTIAAQPTRTQRELLDVALQSRYLLQSRVLAYPLPATAHGPGVGYLRIREFTDETLWEVRACVGVCIWSNAWLAWLFRTY
jgi:hypothetical protein